MPYFLFEAVLILIPVWALCLSVWRLKLSPLSRFPGPKLAALTLWYECYYDVIKDGGGQYVWEIQQMHKKYGPIVRISPNELHVSDPDFYEEIYAGGNRRRDKYIWQTSSGNSAQAMGFTVDHWHHRERREPINPHFSKRNVSRLESLIRLKVEQLCERLEEYSASRQPVNLTVCYLAFTMDVITTYSFGKSSNLLENELNTRWKDTITSIMKSTSVLNHFSWIPKVMDLLPEYLISGFMDMAVLIKLKMDIQSHIKDIVKDNLSSKPSELHASIIEDLQSSMLLPAAEKTISRMTDEVAILVVAGSESPAKTLALIHFHLLNKPSIMLKLRHEVQESIGDSMQIPPLQKLETLPYLSSVIKEGLRMHGGITARSSRVAVDEALQYRQWVIPRGTPLSTSSVFIHRNPDIFPNPSEFIPERWLDSGKLERRLDHYLVAFGKGSRNCVGLNLAFAEMLLALASVVAYFEMDLFMTDVSDVEMVRDWYVPQAKLGSVGVQARVLRRV